MMSDKEFLQRAKEYVETLMADGFFYDEARALLHRFELARQEDIKDRRRSFRVVAGGA
jgi:hypothetical protein